MTTPTPRTEKLIEKQKQERWFTYSQWHELTRELETELAAVIRDMQAQIEAITFGRDQFKALCDVEHKAREDLVEDLGTCELCQRDLITPNPDGSHHNCICLACYNEQYKAREEAERVAEIRLDTALALQIHADQVKQRCAQIEAELRVAAGMLSTMPQFSNDHPEKVLQYIRTAAPHSAGGQARESQTDLAVADDNALASGETGSSVDAAAPPIWEQLAALGESAPAGTWDHVPAEIATPRTDATEHDRLRTLASQEACGESSRLSCSVASDAPTQITDAHLRHLAIKQISDLERENARLRAALRPLAGPASEITWQDKKLAQELTEEQ